ncbi:periplasmic lipoprotein, partial [Pseudomonas savastanoi pv. glycinea str. race 4]
AAYLPARTAYQRIASAAQRLSELDNAINARADYYEKREQDPGFTGFHRIEYALFDQHSVEGLSPVAQRLQTDVTQLKQQLMAQSLAPEPLAAIATRTMRSLADVRSNGEEERYSHSDLNGFAANLDGTRKIVDLLRPLLTRSAADLLQKIDAAMADLDTTLDALSTTEGGMRPYDQVDETQRRQIAAKAGALADALNGIDAALGLSDL